MSLILLGCGVRYRTRFPSGLVPKYDMVATISIIIFFLSFAPPTAIGYSFSGLLYLENGSAEQVEAEDGAEARNGCAIFQPSVMFQDL